MDKSRWPRAEQPGQFNFWLSGAETGAAWILTPVGIEYRLSIRPHFQWWDAYAEFRTQLRPPVCRIYLFYLLITCSALAKPVSTP